MSDLDIQTWPEIPTIAHFCSLFREAFGLFEFDMEQLEESLLLLGSEEEGGLVTKLMMKLLTGCLPMYKKNIKQENYSKYLVQLFQTKLEEAEEDKISSRFENPFVTQNSKEFTQLPLRDKVVVLHQLCEYRLEAPDVAEKVKNLDAASLRVEPLGIDSEGSTLWYFYGTRLYKETTRDPYRLERKRKKKHKKEKKRKRKKLSHSETESSDGLENESSWSVVCLTEEDWNRLTEKYRDSGRKEDRRLYRLLQESFLPEIAEMFKEKEREEKKKEMEALANNKRSSSRIETLKKTQEEKDRLLAIQLAEQAEKELMERRGRRKRGNAFEEGGSYEKEDEGRDERAKQREIMKEMRAKKAAEKLVESKFKDEVLTQKMKVKEMDSKRQLSDKSSRSKSSTRETEEQSRDPSSSESTASSSRDSSPSSDEDDYRPPRKNGPVARASFATALLRAGTKSTKDNNLEKTKVPKETEEKRPIVRKLPGTLLQTAGKGLLNLNRKDNEVDDIFKPKTSCISFGLYGGHLSVDKDTDSPTSLGMEDRPFISLLNQEKPHESTKRIFSNWGGDFFKKNLDFRANTNKILEKMQLNKSGGELSTNGRPADSAVAVGSSILPNGTNEL